jgi:multicomponent Na+:H+ antiporter subunit G
MTVMHWISAILLLLGAFFFLAGTVGLLRFPDVYTRLHALAKVDNLGVGFTVAGLTITAESWAVVLKLLLIWLLALVANATAAYLVADSASRTGVGAWRPMSGGPAA